LAGAISRVVQVLLRRAFLQAPMIKPRLPSTVREELLSLVS